jgi:hypothetical protein
MYKKRLHFLIATLGLAFGNGVVAHSQVPGAVHSLPQQTPAALGNYWTAERMRATKPKDNGLVRPSGPVPSAPALAPGNPGAAGGMFPTVSGVGEEPLQNPKVGPQKESLSSGGQTDAVAASGSFPGPNQTYYYGPKYRTFPISTVGALFFTEPSGDYSCTATVTTGNSTILNVVWTAGHCIANGGQSQFYSNWMFCPSYNGAINPAVGCWASTGAATTTAWYANGAFSRDFGVVFLASTGSVIANQVANVTGSLGMSWNYADDEAWQHNGYPGQTPWTFGDIVTTTTEYRYSVTMDSYGPAVNSWGSAQTPGSSGSALIVNMCYPNSTSYGCPNGYPYINSNVSFYFTSGANGNEYGLELQGPYYDTTTCQLWQSWTGWTGTC